MSETDLSGLEQDEAEFWAWLMEGHIIPEPATLETPNKTSRKFRVVSTEEIKQLIIIAMEKTDERLANKLLNIASETQPLSEEPILRKSIRVGNGEYLKLLYVKLFENTSFSDAIVRMLIPHVRSYLESFKAQWADKLKDRSQRLDHLSALIEKWQSMSPESRSRAVDLGLVDDEYGKYVEAHYPGKAEEIKAALSDFVLAELEQELFPDRNFIGYAVFEEFRKKLSDQLLEEDLLGFTDLEASINSEDADKVLLTPKVLLRLYWTVKEKEKWFERFGEINVRSFLKRWMRKASSKEETGDNNFKYEETDEEIHFNREVSLPTCTVSIKGPDNFEERCASEFAVLDHIKKDAEHLWYLIMQLGKSIGIEADDQFHKEMEHIEYYSKGHDGYPPNEFVANQELARSDTLTNFTKIAVKLSKTASDFSTIKQINSLRSRIISYVTIVGFAEDLVHCSIERRSVVSFYVNKDLWRFLPLAIKGKDWISIANAYLATRQE